MATTITFSKFLKKYRQRQEYSELITSHADNRVPACQGAEIGT